MGKRGKRKSDGTRGSDSSGGGRPSLLLLAAIACLLVAVWFQQIGAFRWLQRGESAKIVQEARESAKDFERPDVILKRAVDALTAAQPLAEGDASWVLAAADSLCTSAAVQLDVTHDVQHAVTVLNVASIQAAASGERDKAIRYELELAKYLQLIKSPATRQQVFLSALQTTSDDGRATLESLPVLEEIIAAGKAIPDSYLVEEGYRSKADALLWPRRDVDGALDVIRECIDWARQQGASFQGCEAKELLLLSWKGDFRESFGILLSTYEELLQGFRPFRASTPTDECRLHLLSSEQMLNDGVAELPHMTVHTSAKAFGELLSGSHPLHCSAQQWPKVLLPDSHAEDGFFKPLRGAPTREGLSWGVFEWTEPTFEQMVCFDDSIKTLRLLEFNDVYIHGPMQTITSSNPCSILHKGYPYTYLTVGKETFHSLPIVEVEKASMLSSFQTNYFHLLIEDTQQMLLPQLFDILDGEVLPLLLLPDELVVKSLSHVQHFGRGADKLIPYNFRSQVFHVGQLFLVDYQFVDGKPAGTHSPEDYYAPSLAVLQVMRHLLTDHLSLPSSIPANERTIVLVKRSEGGPRSLTDFEELRQSLERIAKQRGLSLEVFTGSYSIAEAAAIFNSATVVIGVHGAGLANTIFCQEGTAVVEIPAFPPKPLIFGSLARSLSLDYWKISAALTRQNNISRLNEPGLQQVVNTVDYILQTKGYARVSL